MRTVHAIDRFPDSKSNQRGAIDKILHMVKQEDSERKVLELLAERYLPVDLSCDADYPPYKGPHVESLDEPFSTADVREALMRLNARSAPGPDGISNRILRNLDDASIRILTDEINKVWE
ncbi:hypothetical protein MTO96_020443 [Rhipicephalus appendiculatus]